jgi:pyruvate ferredoxin oxidoreductase alpha subunit
VKAGDEEARPATEDEIVVVAMGSVLGTLQATLPALRADGIGVQLLGVGSYRPFPSRRLIELVGKAKRVVVIDRAIQLGIGGVLSDDVQRALGGRPVVVDSVVAGLGGRPITERSLAGVLRQAAAGELEELTFMDLNTDVLGKAV